MGDVPESQGNYDFFRDRRRDVDPQDVHYREGFEHALAGAEYKGYGAPWKAIQYGAGRKAGTAKKISDAVESRAVCPVDGCGKKHRNADAAVKAHRY